MAQTKSNSPKKSITNKPNANCNCKHAFSKALINKMITSFKINATIFEKN